MKRRPKKSRYFRKDENGSEIFYPWGYPGEGFYVSEQQKINIGKFIRLIYILAFLELLGVHSAFYLGLINHFGVAWTHMIFWTFLPIFYVYKMFFLKDSLKPYKPFNTTIPIVFYVLLFFSIVQISNFIVAFDAAKTVPSMSIFTLISGASAIVMCVLTIYAFKIKGCFFS